MLESPAPHRGSGVYRHASLAGLKPWDASFFFLLSPELLVVCWREKHMAWIFLYYPLFYVYFFFSQFFFSSSSVFFFLLPFCVCPASMKPKSMKTRGAWVSAGWGNQTLFECHMWAWLYRVRPKRTRLSALSWKEASEQRCHFVNSLEIPLKQHSYYKIWIYTWCYDFTIVSREACLCVSHATVYPHSCPIYSCKSSCPLATNTHPPHPEVHLIHFYPLVTVQIFEWERHLRETLRGTQ